MRTSILSDLADVVESRKQASAERSYIAYLFRKGEDAVLKKVGEEAAETLLAAKNGNKQQIIHEMADLWFHCIVTLSYYGLRPEDILAELQRREGVSGLDEKASRVSEGEDG